MLLKYLLLPPSFANAVVGDIVKRGRGRLPYMLRGLYDKIVCTEYNHVGYQMKDYG